MVPLNSINWFLAPLPAYYPVGSLQVYRPVLNGLEPSATFEFRNEWRRCSAPPYVILSRV
jgi:hypothetical protein